MALPLALGMLAIAATGGPGIVKGVFAAAKNAEAEEIDADAGILKAASDESLLLVRDTTTQYIKKLGEAKLAIASREIRNFVDTFRQLKNVELSECAAIDGWEKMEFTEQDLNELQTLSNEACDLMNGGLSGLGTAVLAGIGAYKGVTAFALAGTGTAISSLSGAASVNATLAWFGGGAVAAGGLGVAGGTLILGGLITGPMLLMAGGVMEAKADKNLDIARMNDSQAKQYCAKAKLAITAMGVIADTAAIMHNQLVRLDRRLAASIGKMKRILMVNDHWERMGRQDRQDIALCVEYAQAVKQFIDLPLLGQDGLISRQAKNVYDSFRDKITKEDMQEWKKGNVNADTERMMLVDPMTQPGLIQEIGLRKEDIRSSLVLLIEDKRTHKILRYGLMERERVDLQEMNLL